ncbi:MAG: hypothetical protein LBG87_00915 [Spirochaetaceae bacterium]|nr:hypothetical protein [Spirochaetaceae bacterium]
MEKITAGILLIIAGLAVSSCDQYFDSLTPDKAASGGSQTTGDGGDGGNQPNTGDSTSLDLQLIWE